MVFEQKQPHGEFNKERGDWILQNKFEYGYNPIGGRKLAALDGQHRTTAKLSQINEIIPTIPKNYT